MSRTRISALIAPVSALALMTGIAAAQTTVDTSAGPMQISVVASGFDEPWAVGFLPDGAVMVTERAGRLLLLRDGEPTDITGVPEVYAEGQGGLLDVMIPRDFAQSREVWLTYSASVDGGAATAVGKGRLSDDGSALEGFDMLYVGDGMSGGRHFGSRIVEAQDGTVFITTGDRGTGPAGMQAQNPQTVEGSVIHLNRDGSTATTIEGWRRGIYSIGHRNAQGATLGPDGALWLVEHGAQGGDEVNRVEAGKNYGWPVISYGVNYNGASIGEGQERDGMEQPAHYWDPSIAPSGMIVYSGALVPEWAGDIFTGSLNTSFLSRLDPDTPTETGFAEERIESAETARVRDVREAPDGSIWFVSVIEGAIYRLAPENAS
ncbi:PQQ-dependent sugar dehydrogenase [Pseudotabrizicola sp.]|uniref:PQQ-dependent sugar dehydrogenase n=1 Tax=Pseudotabrizicola sp. TaxID=2939647 RepID=UPI00271D77C6|nr:PQQ-dependent sugar dehydrogenase [Pseudotabrizicola sp.]MDO8881536.1 PQQ-dependent sugar dehydrogenase [Pseudotabrizicola sp.]